MPAVDKRRARLNCIQHLLDQIPYAEVEHPTVQLPERQRHEDYIRQPVPEAMLVPQRF